MPVGEIFLLFLALGESVAQVSFATWNWPSSSDSQSSVGICTHYFFYVLVEIHYFFLWESNPLSFLFHQNSL